MRHLKSPYKPLGHLYSPGKPPIEFYLFAINTESQTQKTVISTLQETGDTS